MNREQYEAYLAQSSLQGQANDSQTTLYAPQLAEQVQQSQAVLVEQTNPNKVIYEIILALRNQEENEFGEIKQLGPPIVNEVGVHRLRFIMRSVINQNTILSHLEDKQISKLMIQLSNDVVDDLTLNWRSYGVRDKSLLDYIVDAIIYPAYFALQRAWGQNEKNWLGKISVENISNGPRIQPKKDSIWSKIRLG